MARLLLMFIFASLILGTVHSAAGQGYSPRNIREPSQLNYDNSSAQAPIGQSYFDPPPTYAAQQEDNRGEIYDDGLYDSGQWTYQWLPESILYRAYLAGAQESRMSGQIVYHDDQVNPSSHAIWDATMGARFGLFRYGTSGPFIPQGFQIDVEGSAQTRLDLDDDADVRSTDYRAGVPLTWGYGRHQTKFAYYHVSSHLGDEFVIKRPGFNRLNFARDAFVLGQAFYITPSLRIYGETSWSFYREISEPWEFQFGLDYAPAYPTGPDGAPFFAVNVHLREEVNFGGNIVVQTGWAWRTNESGHLLRAGLHYFNGESGQLSFFGYHEEQIGFGMWYDF